MTGALSSRAIWSEVTSGGRLRLGLQTDALAMPADDEVVVQVEAAPINPSDLWLLLGPADLTTLEAGGTADAPTLTAVVPADRLQQLRRRWDQRLAVGAEAAGTVVHAGRGAETLLGRRVSFASGGTYSELRAVLAVECFPLPDDVTAEEGAALHVNPMTALAMLEVLRLEGHRALVHTAAASNLGQMLNRLCLSDGVDLVNVVRSATQADVLHRLGARYVVDSTAPSFADDLTAAVAATGATLAFDAVGGGSLADALLRAMEDAGLASAQDYSAYGTRPLKQVYLYGNLDRSPTVLTRTYGMSWAVGGFLMPWFLDRVGPQETARLRGRVVEEARTTFAAQYAGSLTLAEALDPHVLLTYADRATGGKYLITPART